MTRTLTRPLLLAAMAALALVPISAASAVAEVPTPASGVTWDQHQRVDYRWKEGAEPPAWAKAAMNAAAADSNSSRKSKAALFAQRDGGPAWLAYTDDMPTNWAIGYTVRNIPDSFNIKLRPQGTQLDWGTLRWCQFYDDPPAGCYDAEMVMLHEFGHAQTLGHVDEAEGYDWMDTIMHTNVHSNPKVGWNTHVYGPCDVARLQIRYEPLTTSTPISRCLDLATELSLAPAATFVPYGSAVGFTARLKIAGAEIYPNLAGSALSGRSVLLQRRALGLTTWTTVAELPPVTDDSGRYVKTLTLTATYDWRAIFSGPSDEGLRGTISTVSRVNVSYSCPPTAKGLGTSPLYEIC
jgi:hypothetical protein